MLLWSLTVLAGLTASPHELECADEASAFFIHDANGHTVGALRTSGDPLHCVLCHWVRAFSADDVRAPRTYVAHGSSFSLLPPYVETTRAAARLNLPPRAPPV